MTLATATTTAPWSPEAPLEQTEAGLVPEGEGWFVVNAREAAARHGVSVDRETSDVDEAYARFPDVVPTRYREGWLPEG